MNTASDQQAFEDRRAQRSNWTVRKGRLGDPELESEMSSLTPEERLSLVWPLTVQAWALKGIDVSQGRVERAQIVKTRRSLRAKVDQA